MQSRAERKPTHLAPRVLRNPKDQVKKLLPQHFSGAEFATAVWRANISDDVTLEDTLRPEFFCNIAPKLDPGHIIQGVWSDMSKYAEYMVLTVGDSWVKTALLREVSLSEKDKAPAPEKDKSEYSIEFKSPKGWCVFRNSDGERLKTDFQTEAEAETWVSELKKSLK